MNELFGKFQLSSGFLHFVVSLSVLITSAFVAGIIITFVLQRILNAYNKQRHIPVISFLIKYLRKPMRFFLPLLIIVLFLPVLSSFPYYPAIQKTIIVLFYASFTWVLVNLIYALSDTLILQHNMSVKDNLKERQLVTQLQFIRRLLVIIVITISVSAILLNFENIRKLGAGILTSAGILGIIIGFAAQKSIGNLLAGLQIAFTQPIRIDDVIVIENEFGNVEDITLTYVVVRLWDQRRLVVPLNYFIEKPFQNWTKTSSDILATVTIYVDYKMPIDELKQELDRLLGNNPLWNKKASGLQVTGATEHSQEIRALMSANTSGEAWDLRCFVREKLIAFIRDKYPDYLPKQRTEIVNFIKPELP